MNSTFFIIAGLLGLLGGLIFSYPNFKEIMRIRHIRASAINALPLKGKAEVNGKVINNDEMGTERSPLTDVPCKLWQVEVQEQKRRWGGASHSYVYYWETIYKQTSDEPFVINDGTGTVQIFPKNSDLRLTNDTSTESNFLKPLDPQIKQAVEKLGLKTNKGWFPGWDKPLQVYERILELENEIFVLGTFKSENGIRTFRSEKHTPLIISDYSDQGLVLQQLFFGIIAKAIGTPLLIWLVVFWIISRTR